MTNGVAELEKDLSKAVAGEFYPSDFDDVGGPDQLYAWHIKYVSSIPTRHEVLVIKLIRNNNEEEREFGVGYTSIDGKEAAVKIFKHPPGGW